MKARCEMNICEPAGVILTGRNRHFYTSRHTTASALSHAIIADCAVTFPLSLNAHVGLLVCFTPALCKGSSRIP
jgi:hypothetical protein